MLRHDLQKERVSCEEATRVESSVADWHGKVLSHPRETTLEAPSSFRTIHPVKEVKTELRVRGLYQFQMGLSMYIYIYSFNKCTTLPSSDKKFFHYLKIQSCFQLVENHSKMSEMHTPLPCFQTQLDPGGFSKRPHCVWCFFEENMLFRRRSARSSLVPVKLQEYCTSTTYTS